MTGKPPDAFSCLIVDDDVSFATMTSALVKEKGGRTTAVHSLAAATQALAQGQFDLILLDNYLPDGKGYDFYYQAARRNPEAPILMITGAPDLREAVALTRNGLFEFLTKPASVETLNSCLDRALQRIQSQRSTASASEWFGESRAMRAVLQQLTQAARHPDSTVLLTGETGAGKDLAARVLHELSHPGGKAPFIAVNCAALPAEMFESELFGAERGAYTGADKKRGGLAAAAAHGTLFLDEIAEVPLPLQAKLLRLLEAREYRPLGGTEVQPFTGRFVAATNKHLADEAKAGRLREDLMYRLDVFSVEMPPLRQRRTDIPGLAEKLLDQLALRYGRHRPLLTAESLAELCAHSFPGNVRELRNVLERSLLKTPLESRWLALDANWLNRPAPAVPVAAAAVAPLLASPPDSAPLPAERQLSPLEAQEYKLIREVLREVNGGIRRAAIKLGMSPQALLRRLEKWPELRIEKE